MLRGEPEMIEDLPDDRRPLDHGDHLHHAAAARTQEGIDLVHATPEGFLVDILDAFR